MLNDEHVVDQEPPSSDVGAMEGATTGQHLEEKELPWQTKMALLNEDQRHIEQQLRSYLEKRNRLETKRRQLVAMNEILSKARAEKVQELDIQEHKYGGERTFKKSCYIGSQYYCNIFVTTASCAVAGGLLLCPPVNVSVKSEQSFKRAGSPSPHGTRTDTPRT